MDRQLIRRPANRNLVGRNIIKIKGAKGVEFIKAFIEVAKDPDSGWVECWWRRRGEKEPTLKRSYVVKVPGHDIIVGAGYYVETPNVAKKQP
jgi:methyl-accepting chemotaxis protein